MLEGFRKSWQSLKRGEPGSRFEKFYERSQRKSGAGLRRGVFLVLGAVFVLAGIFFLPAPGPGFIIILIGAGMLAQASRTVARFLDRMELKVRPLIARAKTAWRRKRLRPVKRARHAARR